MTMLTDLELTRAGTSVETNMLSLSVMTDAQRAAIVRLADSRRASRVSVRSAFDLPDDYLYVIVTPERGADFHCGVSPDGVVSS